ncbi:hypothetical protein QL285_003372 [Trifolium repens]|nr:hypothetical protein QL285_003372 [Trifolium repens]
MARKSSRRSTAADLKTQKGKKKMEGSTSQTVRVQDSKKVKPKNLPLPQDSSSSDDIDEDYAVFLKTYNPQEFYPSGYTSEEDGGSRVTVEGGSQITVESKEIESRPLGRKAPKRRL